MNGIRKFLARNRTIGLSVLFGIFTFFIYPAFYGSFPFDRVALEYYIGVIIFAAFFLELLGIWYKTQIIYEKGGKDTFHIPVWLRLFFFPRLFVSGLVAAMMFEGFGILSDYDFLLLAIVLIAVSKEFWVRRTLMNKEFVYPFAVSRNKHRVSNISLLLYFCIIYFALWEVVIYQSEKAELWLSLPENIFFASLLFYVCYVVLLLPYFMEELFMEKFSRYSIIIFITAIIPVLGFTLHALILSPLVKWTEYPLFGLLGRLF